MLSPLSLARPFLLLAENFMHQQRKASLSQQPIEYVASWFSKIGSWLEKHLRLVGWGAACILGVIIVGTGLSLYWSSERARGLEAIRSGLVEMTNDQTESAITHFALAAEQLEGRARQLALLKLGEAYEKTDQPDKALQAYEAVLGGESDEEGHYLVQLALLKLGKTAEESGETEVARTRYTKAAEIEGPGQSEAFLATAKILEQVDDAEGAKSYYQKFLDSGVNSPLKEVVEQKID